jgi:TonB family protein
VCPDDAVRGTVVTEATVSRTGCVQRLEVVRGATPLLDLAVIQAVSQWQFATTTLDGAPIPVMMTIMVSFNLH